MIRNGLNLLGVSPFWQGSAIGAIIIVALLAERLVSTRPRLTGPDGRRSMSDAPSLSRPPVSAPKSRSRRRAC